MEQGGGEGWENVNPIWLQDIEVVDMMKGESILFTEELASRESIKLELTLLFFLKKAWIGKLITNGRGIMETKIKRQVDKGWE